MSDENEFDPRPSASGVGDTGGSPRDFERRRKKEAAQERLEEIQDMDDPVERIKDLAVFFRRGPGKHLTSELDMETLLDTAQAKAFEEIEAIAEEEGDPQSYLNGVLRKTDPDLIDDYTWNVMGIVKQVHRRVENLVEYHSSDAGEDEAGVPTSDSSEKRYRFEGPRNELRYLLNEVYKRWVDGQQTTKRDFFKNVAPLFETDSGPVNRNIAVDMAKKVGGAPPAAAREIDDLLKDVTSGDEQ